MPPLYSLRSLSLFFSPRGFAPDSAAPTGFVQSLSALLTALPCSLFPHTHAHTYTRSPLLSTLRFISNPVSNPLTGRNVLTPLHHFVLGGYHPPKDSSRRHVRSCRMASLDVDEKPAHIGRIRAPRTGCPSIFFAFPHVIL